VVSDQKVNGRRTWLFFALFVLVLGAALTWANFNFLNTPSFAHRDFMSLWGGGWAIRHDVNIFDPEVWAPLRLELGSKWRTGDAGNPFPMWTLLLVMPLSLLPLGWGAAVWLALSQLLLGLVVYFLLIELGRRKPSVFEFALIAIGVFAFRGTLVTMLNGQITIILMLALTLFLVFVKRDKPFWAGVALAFIILKPNPFIIFAPMIALWLILRRKWEIIAGGVTAVLVMLAATWIILPGWLLEWQNVREKTGSSPRSFIMPTLWGAGTEISVQWAPLIGLLLVGGLTLALGWYLYTRSALNEREVVSLAIAASLLATPYAWAYEHMLLLIPLILYFTRLDRRWLAWVMWLGLAFILPWLFFQVSQQRGAGTTELLTPLLVLIVVWLLVIFKKEHREAVPVPGRVE
jgi:hypothetical protein